MKIALHVLLQPHFKMQSLTFLKSFLFKIEMIELDLKQAKRQIIVL